MVWHRIGWLACITPIESVIQQPRKEKDMSNYDERVFARSGAHELAPEELEILSSNLHTSLPCTFEPPNFHDGECAL